MLRSFTVLALCLVPASALASDALWLVAEKDEAAALEALVQGRTERELALARTDYADSRFDACNRRLTRLEERVRWQIRGARSLPLVKQINLWLGLCRGVADERGAARAAFARAVRLPGPGPDPSLFPPAVMELYRSAHAPEGGCRLRLPHGAAEVELDGRPVRAGAEVVPGEHYVVWDERSDRRKVDGDCRLDLGAPPSPPALRLDEEEAVSPGFLQALGRGAHQERVVIAHRGGSQVTLSVFDVAGRRFISKDAPLVGLRPPATPAPETRPVEGDDGAGAPPWYRRWWVWALVGGVVVTAVVVPVALTQSGETRYEVGF